MPDVQLTSCWPYLIVEDLAANVSWFHSRLGFDLDYHEPGIGFAIVCRDEIRILLRACGHAPTPLLNAHFLPGEWPRGLEPYDLSIQVDDVAGLHDELQARGANPTAVEQRGYGRDTEVTTPDGYQLVFLQLGA